MKLTEYGKIVSEKQKELKEKQKIIDFIIQYHQKVNDWPRKLFISESLGMRMSKINYHLYDNKYGLARLGYVEVSAGKPSPIIKLKTNDPKNNTRGRR